MIELYSKLDSFIKRMGNRVFSGRIDEEANTNHVEEEIAEAFDVFSQKVHICKFKSQNVVYTSPANTKRDLRSRQASSGHSRSLSEVPKEAFKKTMRSLSVSKGPTMQSVTYNHLDIFLRRSRGLWAHALVERRFPFISREANIQALEFSLKLKRTLKQDRKKPNKYYEYYGAVISRHDSIEASKRKRNRSRLTSIYDPLEANGNVEFHISRCVIVEDHKELGPKAIRTTIQRVDDRYYDLLLNSFHDLFIEEADFDTVQFDENKRKVDYVSDPVFKQMERSILAACDVSKVIMEYLPPISAYRQVSSHSQNFEDTPDRSLENSMFKMKLSNSRQGLSLNRMASASNSKNGMEPSDNDLMQDMELEIDFESEHEDRLTFCGRLCDVADGDMGKDSGNDILKNRKGNSKDFKQIEFSDLIAQDGFFQQLQLPAPSFSRERKTSAIMDPQFVPSKFKGVAVPFSGKLSRRSSINAEQEVESFSNLMEPSAKCIETVEKFQEAASVNIVGKLPDVYSGIGVVSTTFNSILKICK